MNNNQNNNNNNNRPARGPGRAWRGRGAGRHRGPPADAGGHARGPPPEPVGAALLGAVAAAVGGAAEAKYAAAMREIDALKKIVGDKIVGEPCAAEFAAADEIVKGAAKEAAMAAVLEITREAEMRSEADRPPSSFAALKATHVELERVKGLEGANPWPLTVDSPPPGVLVDDLNRMAKLSDGISLIYDKTIECHDLLHWRQGTASKIMQHRFESLDWVAGFVGFMPKLIVEPGPSVKAMWNARSEKVHFLCHAATSEGDNQWEATAERIVARFRGGKSGKHFKCCTVPEYKAGKLLEAGGRENPWAGFATICTHELSVCLAADGCLAGRARWDEVVLRMHDMSYHLPLTVRAHAYRSVRVAVGVMCMQSPVDGYVVRKNSVGEFIVTQRVGGDGVYCGHPMWEVMQPGAIRLTDDVCVNTDLKTLAYGMVSYRIKVIGDVRGKLLAEICPETPIISDGAISVVRLGTYVVVRFDGKEVPIEAAVVDRAMMYGMSHPRLRVEDASAVPGIKRDLDGWTSFGIKLGHEELEALIAVIDITVKRSAVRVVDQAESSGREVPTTYSWLQTSDWRLRFERAQRYTRSMYDPTTAQVSAGEDRRVQGALLALGVCYGGFYLWRHRSEWHWPTLDAREAVQPVINAARGLASDLATATSPAVAHAATTAKALARDGVTAVAQSAQWAFKQIAPEVGGVLRGLQSQSALEWVPAMFVNVVLEEALKAALPWWGASAFAALESVLYGELARGDFRSAAVRQLLHNGFTRLGGINGVLVHFAYNVVIIAGNRAQAACMFRHSAGLGVEARLTPDLRAFELAQPTLPVRAVSNASRQTAPQFDMDGLTNGISYADAPVFENVCGAYIAKQEAHPRHGLNATIERRHCEGGPGLYFLGGLVPTDTWLAEQDEARIGFTARPCNDSLDCAISRYGAKEAVPVWDGKKGDYSDRTLEVEAAWIRIVSAEWYHVVRRRIRVSVGYSIPEYAGHLTGNKRHDFLSEMEQARDCDTSLRAMSKNNQKTFNARKPYRILMYQPPQSLAVTGPYAYSAEHTVHDVLYHKYDLPIDEQAQLYREVRLSVSAWAEDFEVQVALPRLRPSRAKGSGAIRVYIFATGDDNHVIGHYFGRKFDLEQDIRHADASGTVYGRSASGRIYAATGYWPDPSATNQQSLWTPNFERAMWADERGEPVVLTHLRCIEGTSTTALLAWVDDSFTYTANSKHKGYRIRLPPGVVASGTSITNGDQTIVCSLALVGGLAAAGRAIGAQVIVCGPDEAEVVLTPPGVDRAPVAIEAFFELVGTEMERLNYSTKAVLHEFAAPKSSMCSAYFYPALIDGVPVHVPFIKLGRWLRRLSTLNTSISRAAVNGVVLGMLIGYKAMGGWLHFVTTIVDMMMAWVPQGTQAIELSEWRVLQRPVGEIVAAELDVQIDWWCRIYSLTPTHYFEVLADFERVRPGRAIESAVLDRMLDVEA